MCKKYGQPVEQNMIKILAITFTGFFFFFENLNYMSILSWVSGTSEMSAWDLRFL